ncbi:MAG: aminodeoxychorismate/anthranilate synthase component II [Eubacteriales bacterium]
MILLIDNYDSFSYNLYQLIGGIDEDIRVIRNDLYSVKQIASLRPSHIVLSPGPGYPKDAGVCIDTVKTLGGDIPILGVCLGHQAICEAYGAVVSHAKQLMHGKQSVAALDTQSVLFQGLPDGIKVARYHSLAAIRHTLPSCLTVTAQTEDGEVMAVAHRDYPVFGVQFHPESILTEKSEGIIRNFLKGAKT